MRPFIFGVSCILSLACAEAVLAADLKNLTDSVMNGWRKDYQNQMGSVITSAGCSGAVDFKNLTDAVMNGWRKDYQIQIGSLLSCISG